MSESPIADVRIGWTTVVLDCTDPLSLANFWSQLLNAPRTRINDDFHVVQSGTTWLAAQRISAPKEPTWPTGERPKQIHLDIAVSNLESAVAKAIRLGATQDDTQPRPTIWRVMRDPAGHVFCLSDHIQDYLPVEL